MRRIATIAAVVWTGCQGLSAESVSVDEVASIEQAVQGPQAVNVVNSAGSPVPVAATQSGQWNVNVVPGALVKIDNIPTVALREGSSVNVGTLLNVPPVDVASLPPVAVANFPATQSVSGAVEVLNLPATQAVSGTVAVSSLPPVTVSNLPATQAVSGTVAVSSLPSVTVSNLPSTQTVTGSVTISNLPSTQTVSVSNTPNVKIANTTTLLSSQMVALGFGEFTPVDVSACAKVRVFVRGVNGVFSIDIFATVGGGIDLLDTFNDGGTRVYDVPGTHLEFGFSGSMLPIVTVSVFCRA